MMTLSTVLSTLELGCIFAILALGLFVSFRILNLPDLTVDGSFVTGAAMSAMATTMNHPVLGLFLALGGGALAGLFTGLLHTKLKIQEILAGILTMTALYSINLKITLNKPSVFFYGTPTIFTPFLGKLEIGAIPFEKGGLLLLITVFVMAGLFLFLKTHTGLALRATGDNEAMVRASSINTDIMKILGFMVANALVSLSGGLYAQYQQSFDHSVGTGMLVLGLASIIMGETLFGKRRLLPHLISIVLGAILYRYFITFAFMLGLPASDLKLFSAFIVIAAISLPLLSHQLQKWRKDHDRN